MPAAWIERGTVLIQLGRHHLAFYRGYLDGLDLRTLARRYLETTPSDDGEIDLRLAKSMVKWIRDQLMVTARRSGYASSAKVLRLEPETLLVTYTPATPSLDVFREERDPHDMFSEQELIDLFNDEYGTIDKRALRRTQRNNRLRSKQLFILHRLEALTDSSPRPDDGVDGWLDPALARRLIDAGIPSLGVLVTVINSRGFRWYTKVPRLGAKAAQQIVDWLMLPETVASLGMPLAARGSVPRKDWTPEMLAPAPMQTAIVPLENFLVPHDLNGAFGSNRGERSSLSARNDLEAIYTWLARYQPGGHTHRAYRKETERFLLWSILERGEAAQFPDGRRLYCVSRFPLASWAANGGGLGRVLSHPAATLDGAKRYRAPLCPLAAFRRAALGELAKNCAGHSPKHAAVAFGTKLSA